MRQSILLFFRISLFVMVLSTVSACLRPHPPTIYEDAKRRLSDYENNYFIKIPEHYAYVQSPSDIAPDFSNYRTLLKDTTSLFNNSSQIVVGVFRWQQRVNPFAWFEMIDASKSENPPDSNHPLVKNILNQFDLEELASVELKTYKNFLVMELHQYQEEAESYLKMAVQPYAIFKSGPRNNLFITFILYTPEISEIKIERDFENLLDNTELSYFLNYERSMEKTLTFK